MKGKRFPFFSFIAGFFGVTVLALLTGNITSSLYYALDRDSIPKRGDNISSDPSVDWSYGSDNPFFHNYLHNVSSFPRGNTAK